MDFTAMKRLSPRVLLAMTAMMAATGSLQAANLLTATPSTVSVSCGTVAGVGTPQTIVVKPVATPPVGGIVVGVAAQPTGVVVTAPTITTLTGGNTGNATTGITYTVSAANLCANFTTGSGTFHFTTGTGANVLADVTVTVNTTYTQGLSGLSTTPVTISCTKSGSTYTPGPAQTVTVGSTAVGGTSFTINTSSLPAWLTVTGTGGTAAPGSPATFSVSATPTVPASGSNPAVPGCGGLAVNTSATYNISLPATPAPTTERTVAITIQVVPPTPLVATPSPSTLSYTKLSGTPGSADVRITSSNINLPNPFFTVNTATLPNWLTVDAVNGTAPKTLHFTTTAACDNLAQGTYTGIVYVKVSGYADLPVTITALITNKPARLTVQETNPRNLYWTIGSPLPTPTITAVSSDAPIPYTATSGGALNPIISSAQQSGLAYSFGTPISVTFSPTVFASAQPGNILTGTVTLTWGSPVSTVVVTFNITVQAPGATLTGLNPGTIPTAVAGQTFNISLLGSGFVSSPDPTQKTRVGIVVAGQIVSDSNFTYTVVNPSNISLTINVPATADANLPFTAGTGANPVIIGICNPSGSSCSTPTGTQTLNIGSNPIIQAVTSASSFQQVSLPNYLTVAPYDMVTIFGSNFCSSGGSGCASSQLLYGAVDQATLRYGTLVSPDSGLTPRNLTVTFQKHSDGSGAVNAPILFATNNQINVMVPSGLATNLGAGGVDIVVNFGATGSIAHSVPYTITVAPRDIGIFTVGADGQGNGAILNSNYSVISQINPAGVRSTAGDSDTIQIYLTGLGTPDSTGDNSAAGTNGGAVYPTDCVTPASYIASLNTYASNLTNTNITLANADGTIIQSSLLNSYRLPPCFVTAPTVTVGGVAATVTYAGFAPDTVAGLYQINATLPPSTGSFTTVSGANITNITAPVQLPVSVSVGSAASQTGVSVWVAPSLKVVAPSGAGLTGTVGIVWSSSNNSVTASEGTGSYHYAVTSGVLPSGLLLNGTTGAITGTPNAGTAGTYVLTVTATDSASVPVTGTVTFTLTIAGGLFMSATGTAPYAAVFGTAASISTVTATSGVYPYTYSIATIVSGSAVTIPASTLAINPATGAVTATATTPAGTYHVTVTATDSTAVTPLTGTITFDIVVGLHMSRTAPVAGANGSASNISTVSATGNTGTLTFNLDATSAALNWLTIDHNTGLISITNAAPSSTVVNATVTAIDGTAPANAASAGTGTIPVTITIN